MADEADPDDPGSEVQGTERSKVASVIERYDLLGTQDELERRWLGVDRERQSLRELATWFNQRVLEAALENQDSRPIEGEVANLYRLLDDEDVPASARTEAETKLSRLGIDVDSLRGDFVTHQAIYTYLTGVRGVSSPDTGRSPDAAVEGRRDTIQRLRSRLAAVSERSLEGLRDAGHVSVGSFDVMVRVTVHCTECGTTVDVADLLDQRGCDCPANAP